LRPSGSVCRQARISQIRRELHDAWQRFQGEPSPTGLGRLIIFSRLWAACVEARHGAALGRIAVH